MKGQTADNRSQSGELASLSPELLDAICEAVLAKLSAQDPGNLLPKQDVEGPNPFTRSTTDINHSYFASRHLDYMCLPGEVAQITGTISAKYTRRQCTTNHMDEYRLLQKESL